MRNAPPVAGRFLFDNALAPGAVGTDPNGGDGPHRADRHGARIGEARTVFDGCALPTPVYDRQGLLPGNALPGPAIVTEYSATVVVPPWAACRIDALGNLVVECPGAA